MEQMTLDYTLPVEAVVKREKDTPQQRIWQFVWWARMNPEAIQAMYAHAKAQAHRIGYVSANYLLEWLRYDSGVRINGVEGDFKAPNTYATIFARYLANHDDELKQCLQLNKSDYDGCEFPPIDWSY